MKNYSKKKYKPKYVLFFSMCIFGMFCTCIFCDNTNSKVLETPRPISETINISNIKSEFLPFDSILINKKIPLIADSGQIIKNLGQPDTIIFSPFNNSTMVMHLGKDLLPNKYYLMFGNTVFVGAGNGYFVAHCIDFESTNVDLSYRNIILNKETQPLDIQNLFPESGKLIQGGGNAWFGYIQLRVSKNYSDDRICFLIFKGGRLSRVVLYSVPIHN